MLRYWLWLTTRPGLGHRGAYLVASHFASPEQAYYASEAEYAEISGLRDYRPLLDKDMAAAEQIQRSCYEKGISILTFQDAAYPVRLKNIDDPPVVLYYRGTLPDLNGPVVSVVGTRECSAYGLLQAQHFGYALSRCGCIVVSGMAKGIDTMAITGALTGGSPVVAVLGGGVDVVYPASNRGLYHDVEQYGCLISEYPPGTQTIGVHFPVRNRIISGLSLGVLVVEAPEKSGALITASRALDQGRDVFAVPANVDVYSCRGNLKLLREGAIVARDAWDVLQEYAALYPTQLHRASAISFLPEKQQPKPEPVRPQATAVQSSPPAELPQTAPPQDPAPGKVLSPEKLERLSPDERVIVQVLEPGVLHIDELVNQTKLPAGRVLASLTLLEVKGIVRRQPGKRFALA